MLTVYGIKSCEMCRTARKYLDEQDIEYQFHDVRDDGLDMQTLQLWATRIDWQKLLNRRSITWRKIPEVDRNDMDRDRALALMLERPTLLKRPILEAEKFLAVGFSEERFKEIWTQSP